MLITSTDTLEIAQTISDYVGHNAPLITVGEQTDINLDELIQALDKLGVVFMGGVFPKVIHGTSILDQGIVVNTLNNLDSIFLIKNISSKAYTIPKIVFDENQNYSLLTYVDGLTSNISHYLSELYENYGMQTNYFGGGAGSITLEQKPCVFNNEGVFQDAAVFGVMKMKSSIGVKHGWSKIAGPFVITKAEGNVIQEINWKNPFDVYKEVVELHSGQTFTDDNFFDIAKGYPFGILKDNSECIVRDPLMVNEEGQLICVGELENNTVVDILNGDSHSLINAAQSAATNSLLSASSPRKAIIIDCISRVLFLQDNFNNELTAVSSTLLNDFPSISIGGAVTLGEISSYGEGFLEFYNKTIVVGLFE